MAGFYKDGKPISQKKKKGFTVVHNDKTANSLEYDGINFGVVTDMGLKAIKTNTLDSYSPETEEEKKAINSYKGYLNEKAKKEERELKGIKSPLPIPDTVAKTSSGGVKINTIPTLTEVMATNFVEAKKAKDPDELNTLYSMTTKEIEPHLKEKDSVAYTTPDGQVVKWEDLYNDAYLREYTQRIKDAVDVNKNGKYSKKDVTYTYPWGSSIPVISDHDAHLYNFVNGEKRAVDIGSLYNVHSSNTYDFLKNKHLTDEEKQLFNAIWEEKGAEKAKEYLSLLNSDLRERRITEERKNAEQVAKESPVGSSVASVIANVGNNALALPLMAADYLDDGGIDTNSSLYTNRRMVNTTRSTVEDSIDNDVGKFFYRHGMNLADNVATQAVSGFGALGKVSKVTSTALMMSGSFVDTAHDAKRRGLSDEKALALGAIAGGAEYFFESKSFDALFGSESLAKGGWGYALDNIKTEVVGELGTELTNDVADVLLARDLNNFKLEYDGYIKAGDSKKEAWKKTFNTTLKKYGDIVLGTVVTSGAMASPGAISTAKSQNETGKIIRSKEQVGELLNIAKTLPKESSGNKLYSKFAKKEIKTDNISDSQVGILYDTLKSDAYGTITSKKATAEQKSSAYQVLQKLNELIPNNVNQTAQSAEPTVAPDEEPTSAKQNETEAPIVSENNNVPENALRADNVPKNASETINVPETETVQTVPAPQEAKTESVNVGDTFTDTKNGDTIKVVSRDENTTTLEFTNKDGDVATSEVNNNAVDVMNTNPRYVKTETVSEQSTENVPTAETETVSSKEVEAVQPITETANTEPSVEIGTTFVDTKTGSSLKVIDRDDNKTTIEKTTPDGKVVTQTFNNDVVEKISNNPQYTPEIEQPIAETKTTKKNTKTTKANAPLSKKDLNAIKKWERFAYQEENGNYYVSNGSIVFLLTKEQADSAMAEWKDKNGAEPPKVSIFGSKFKELTSYESQGVVSEINPTETKALGNSVICVADGIGYLFNKNYADMASRHCKEMKVLSNGSWATTALVGYDESGNATVVVLPLRNEHATINGVEMFTGNGKATSAKNKSKSNETMPKETTQNAQNASNLSDSDSGKELPSETQKANTEQNTSETESAENATKKTKAKSPKKEPKATDIFDVIKETKNHDGKYWSPEKIKNFYNDNPDLDFIERIYQGDKNAIKELKEMISSITDAEKLEDLSWYVGETFKDKGYTSKTNYDTLKIERTYPYRGAVTKFRNAIKSRIHEIMTEKNNGTNLGIENRKVSLDKIHSLFTKLNSNNDMAELADRVFDLCEKLHLDISFVNKMLVSANGLAVGDIVQYKTSFFNDTAVTDQEKARTILHELIHSCTAYALQASKDANAVKRFASNPEVYQRLVATAKQLGAIYNEIKNDSDFKDTYGKKDVHEMVAELSNPDFVAKLQKKNLWDRIVDAICKLLGILKKSDAYSNIKACVDFILSNFDEGLYNQYAKDQRKALRESGKGDGHYSYSSIANTFFGDPKMTTKKFESGDYKQTEGYKNYVDKSVNVYLQTHKGVSAEEAQKVIENSIDGIVEVALASKKAGYDIFDDNAKRNKTDSKNRLLFSSLEPNSDYFTSSDISTICDKRQNFADIYDAIVKKEEELGVPNDKRFFNNVDNYFYIHGLMAEMGLTTPCRQCYVESMRKNLAPMAKNFLKLIGETNIDNKANDQLYHQSGKDKGNLKSNNAELRESVLEKLTEYGMSPSDLTIATLSTEDGLARLKIQAPLIYEAFNSFYGQSKPKMPKSATPFRFGELTALLTDEKGKIKQSLVNKINSTGGFRLQSYSDFQIQNYVDVLQTIFEAGTLGLSGHAYTKVPAFLKATEGTNLKRNMSIFMYKDGNEWKIDLGDSYPATLDELYDTVALDKSGNTSIIAVSQNEDMSAWIMANDNVGYGIPFHKSGMKMDTVRATEVKTEDGRTVKGYSNIKDHTRQQTEVWAKTTADHKANTKVKKGIDIYSFWDFDNKDNLSKNDLIKKNLMAYIDACEEAGYLPKFREYVMFNNKILNSTLKYAKELGFVPQDATIEDIAFKYKGFAIPYGYHKFLGDFGMFTPDGKASPISPLSLENYDFNKAVKFFNNSKELRRDEILQQFANDGERQKMRDSGKSAEELSEIVRERRDKVADKIISKGKKKLSISEDGGSNERTDLLSGDSRRANNESTQKQTQGLSENERKKTAREILSRGQTEQRIVDDVKLNLVKEDAYNDDMKSIAEENKAKGLNAHFFLGNGNHKFDSKKRILVDGMIVGNDVYLRYDGKFAPQTLNRHEDVHSNWYTEETQKAKDAILNSLTEADKADILSRDRYKKYAELYKNDKDGEKKVWEEFVADVLAGMSTYSSQFEELAENYWNSNDANLDNFKVSEYTRSTDAGGTSNTIPSNKNSRNKYALPHNSAFLKILTKEDWSEFYRSLGELKRGMWFPKNQDGDYIFETNDKLIFTDGDYIEPTINQIVTFDKLSVEEIEFGKEIIWNASERGKSCEECCEIARKMFRKGTITATNPYSHRTNWRGADNSRKRGSGFEVDGKSEVVEDNNEKIPSSVLDLEYLVAAYRGNVKVAEKMVGEKAKANGYTVKAYHGTGTNFNVFSEEKIGSRNVWGKGFYFSTSKGIADDYASWRKGKRGKSRIISAYLKMNNPFMPHKSSLGTAEEILDKWFSDMWQTSRDLGIGYIEGKLENSPLDLLSFIAEHNNTEIRDVLAEYGYDSIKDSGELVVFKSNQIKSAEPITYDDDGDIIPLSQRFDSNDNDIRYSANNYANTFYSHMAKVVDGIKQEKLGTDSVIPYLTGRGVKAEEIKWSGIESWLEGKKSVTKAELQEFVASSMLQIEEKTSEGGNSITLERSPYGDDSWYVMRGGAVFDTVEWNENSELYESDSTGLSFLTKDKILDYYKKNYESGDTRWSEYALEGGNNYRELVFKMPNSSYTNTAMQAHWGEDAEGVLAHARVQDMTTKDGNKMLFVEEIQSDWHNEGHKKGYVDKVILPDLSNYEIRKVGTNTRTNTPIWSIIDKSTGFRVGAITRDTEQEAWDALTDTIVSEGKRNQVPDAPFRDNYHEYVLKRLIRMAVEDGYDSIGWTTADIQSERWSDDYAEAYRIEYDQDIPKFLNKYGKKWGAKVGKETLQDTEVWSMPITDAMKESVLYEGQPMYSLSAKSDDYVQTNSKAVMTDERIDYLIEDSGAGSRQDYANYWITSISPTDFINLTTSEKTQDRKFFDELGSEWNPESNMSTYDYMGELKRNMRQTPYLAIDINTGEVVGHEGRHRMRALEQNGITSAEIRVEFRDEDGRIVKYSPDGKRLQIKDAVQLINQFGTNQTAIINNVIPLNNDYRNEILENYGEKTAQDADIHYSISAENETDEDTVAKWDEALEKYGAIQKGEIPSRDIDVPKKRAKDEPISWFARTALEAGITPNEVIDDFRREIMFGKMAHEVITDKKSEEKAIAKITELGFAEAVNEWNVLTKNGKVGKEDFVFGMVLYNQAVTNKDYKLAMKLISDLTVEASNSAQVLQSIRMLKKMSPDGTLYYLEKSVEKMNEEFKEQLGDKFKDIEIDSDLMKGLYEAETIEERNEALEKIEQNIADQIPSTHTDKWNAWRYLAMLGNVRTHGRNIFGNLSNWGARKVKNLLGTLMEKAIPTEQRTKSVKKTKESIAFAEEDAEAMKDILTGTGGKYEMANKIQQKRKIFKTKWLEFIRRKNFDFLEAEDWWFLKDAYQDSLAQLITARKIDVNSLKAGTSEANDLLNKIRAYAINEAKVATFRQMSELGNVINRTKRELARSKNIPKKGVGILLEGVLPFTNVPINIAKQGIAFSPIGLGKGIKETLWDVRKGDKTASEAIDTLAKGLTGTAIVALGVFLNAMGWIVAEPDDDDKKNKYDKMRGHQSFALQIGDSSYTIDWLTPSSLPLFVGVELCNLAKAEHTNPWDVLNALSRIADPMVELSVLQGVSDAIENAKYADESSWVSVPMGMLTSYVGQALPTLGGQIARLIDDKQRTVYIEKGEGFLTGQIKRFIQTSAKKIPFASKLLEPQIDAWGETKTYGSVAERIAESTVSPGYYSKITTTEVDEELHKLFETTGDNAVYPASNTVKSFKQNKKEYILNAQQSREFAEERGKRSLKKITNLINNKRYASMTDKEKLKWVKHAYDKAYEEAKDQIIKKYFKE